MPDLSGQSVRTAASAAVLFRVEQQVINLKRKSLLREKINHVNSADD
jgi:hypothetical protein